jgi:hypothetical protein
MQLFSSSIESSIQTNNESLPKKGRGRPKGSKNKNPYPVTDAVRQAARERILKLAPEERSARAKHANKFAGTYEERVARMAHARQTPMSNEAKRNLSEKTIIRNKSSENRAKVSASLLGRPGNPNAGRKRGGKNKNPLPRESYLHLKPPKPTEETFKKSGLSRRGKKHSAEHCEALRRSNNRRIENGTFRIVSSMKGTFNPQNPEKYAGNPENIIYRSSWELRVMSHLDKNKSVIQWSSEELFIEYFDPTTNRVRRYFPDFVVKVKDRDGIEKITMIEVKPEKQTMQPKKPESNKKIRRYMNEVAVWGKNTAKWKAAEQYCLERGWSFQILTENHIFKRQ